VHITAAEVY